MIPFPSVPSKQAEACDQCQHNVFGTAERGRGKRCGDRRKVLFLLADDLQKQGQEELERAIKKAPHYQLSVPGGSLKGFGNFLGSLVDLTPNGSLQEAVVEITTEPNQYGAYTIEFRFLDVVPREAMPFLLKRGEATFDLLARAFPVIEHDEEAKKPVKGQANQQKRR
jgi:hypothetical protein